MRKYKLGDKIVLVSDGTREHKAIIRKIENDKLWISFLDTNTEIAIADGVQGFVYDYRIKKIIPRYPFVFKEWIAEWFKNIWEGITSIPHKIGNFFWQIKQFFRWGWFMRENWDWDWRFLLEIMDKKMGDMAKYHRKHGVTLHRHSYARQIELTRKYLKRVMDDTASEEGHKAIEGVYGEQDWYMEDIDGKHSKMVYTEYSKCVGDPKKQKEAEEEYRKVVIELMPKAGELDRKIFFALMQKYLLYWWD